MAGNTKKNSGNQIVFGVFIFVVVLIGVVFLFKQVKDDAAEPAEATKAKAAVEQKVKKPRNVPRKKRNTTSSKEAKMNYVDEGLTPEYVQEQTQDLLANLTSKVELSQSAMESESDPRLRLIIQRRIEGTQRIINNLKKVNPNDESTWFFLGKKGLKGAVESDTINNDFVTDKETGAINSDYASDFNKDAGQQR